MDTSCQSNPISLLADKISATVPDKKENKQKKKGSVEIPDLLSLPEIHDEPVFDGYRKGGATAAGN